jgi:hypothetical protein
MRQRRSVPPASKGRDGEASPAYLMNDEPKTAVKMLCSLAMVRRARATAVGSGEKAFAHQEKTHLSPTKPFVLSTKKRK